MRVLIVAEKEGTAIHRLAVQKAKACWWHSFKIVCVHPKRPSPDQLSSFEAALSWCDVIDFMYWKTAELLHSMYDIKKPSMLTHCNPYDVNKLPWTNYNINVVLNQEQHHTMRVPNTVIELPVDLDFWEYQYLPSAKVWDVLMVSNRIEGKKGVLPVAQACKELGLKMALVGDISDPAYYQSVIDTGVVQFFHKIPDEQLRDLYYQSKIHVCNSVDNYESGTLPILEAMACGTPVITRKVGHVPDINSGRNMVVRRGEPEDTEELKNMIADLLNNPATMKEISNEARHSLRYRGYDLYALKYSRLYHQLLHPEQELTTVITPTVSTANQLVQFFPPLFTQTHQAFEIIVVHDGTMQNARECRALIEELRASTPYTIKFFQTIQWAVTDEGEPYKTYGLARARNKAILEAEGKWLWFVDDRMVPNKDALEMFYFSRQEGKWQWGIKDGVGKSFVENFSFVDRQTLIKVGSFSEQITQYGGMTQEVRKRWELNKNYLHYNPAAGATTSRKSSSKFRRGVDIAKSKAQCYKLYG